MKRIEKIEAIWLAGLIGAFAFATIVTDAHAAGIERMGWLAGCWKGGSGERVASGEGDSYFSGDWNPGCPTCSGFCGTRCRRDVS